MTTKEIARAFDMTITAFGEYVGYTRVALKTPSRWKRRGEAAARLLELKSQQMLEQEIRLAQERYAMRAEAIAEFVREE